MNMKPELREYLDYLVQINQDAPRIGNRYLQDTALRQYVEEKFQERSPTFLKELERLGDRFNDIYLIAAKDAERNPPVLEQFDSYGKRIDKFHLAEGWATIAKLSAEDGIVALAYEEDKYKLGDLQRFGQLVVLMMYQPAALYSCPLAATDGAAYTIKKEKSSNQQLKSTFRKLTSRNPQEFWTSGQWMTEKRGGSDISNTETIAIQEEDTTHFRLYGYKWFTSVADSQMTLALAKIIPPGVKDFSPKSIQALPLSLFYIQMRNKDGELNNMEIIRLKDKLGTKPLPTAEILLKGARAILVSQSGKGVKSISHMLTVTRLYNASLSIGLIRRIVSLARDYANRRIVGKQILSDNQLHLSVLSDIEVIYRGNLIFYLKIAELFSKEQANSISNTEANLLRMMTPLLKLFTAKEAMSTVSEGLECFGGLGYIEGTGLPGMLRDSQLLTIWEGTTNVLCMDFVRSLYRSPFGDPIESFCFFAISSMVTVVMEELHYNKQFDEKYVQTAVAYSKLVSDLKHANKTNFVDRLDGLRSLCFGLCRIFIALLLMTQATNDPRSKHIEIFARWVAMKDLYLPRKVNKSLDKQLALDLDVAHQMRNSGEVDSRECPRPKF